MINPHIMTVDLGGTWHLIMFYGIALTLVYMTYRGIFQAWQGYIFLYCAYVIEYPARHYGEYTALYQVQAAQTMLEVWLIPFAAFYLSPYFKKVLLPVVLIQLFCIWTDRVGLLNQSSFNLAFCAASIPFLPLWFVPVVIGTSLFNHGSTALLIMGAQALGYFLTQPRRYATALAVVVPILVVSAWQNSGVLFDGGERLTKYRQALAYWSETPKRILFGEGPGSYLWTSIGLDDFKAPLFLHLHSDWLQVLFEYGLIGLVLVLGFYLHYARQSFKYPARFAAILGIGAFALTYYPLRHFPSAVLCASVFLYNGKDQK